MIGLANRGIRIECLNAWRGLAALMVVVLHVVGPAILGPFPELGRRHIYRSATFGIYGVQIFFVVSGLCVAQAALRALTRPAPFTSFVMARIRRIYPPYAIVSLLGIGMSGAAAILVSHQILPGSSLAAERLFARHAGDYACSIFLMQRVCNVNPLLPIFWTLCYEAAFYALVAGAMFAAIAFKRDSLVFYICHGITLLCSLALLVHPAGVSYPFDLWPEFGLGVIALDILILRRSAGFCVLFATIALQIGYACSHLSSEGEYKPSVGIATFSSIAFCLLLLALHPLDHKISRLLPIRILGQVGVFSYSLYLVHWLIIGIVSQVMKKIYVVSADSYWISAVVQVAAAVIFAKLFYRFAEQPFLERRPVGFPAPIPMPGRIVVSLLPLPRRRPVCAKLTVS